jgi:prepilin-type N-terminal cleavage/methylation domain-containing protein
MRNHSERGFTLVEIVIVMAMLGILATMAAPNLRSLFTKNRLRSSTSLVTSSLYMARTKAVNEGRPYGVRFDTNGRFYVVDNPGGTPAWTSKPYILESGVSITSNNFVSGIAIFNEFGQLNKTCLSSGSLTGTIILSDGSPHPTRVDVTLISGRIRETNP